jgi:hypothetical protein
VLVHIVNASLKVVYRCQLHLFDLVSFNLCTCQTAGNIEQSIESARLFLQSSELGLPHTPSHAGECGPLFGSGGRTHRIAGEGEEGGPNSVEGTDTGTPGIHVYVLCG